MPNKKKNGEYKDICFPLNKELRAEITEAVISAYENAREEDE
jgi:DNA-binding cell septation regulator SpoVG